MAEAVIPAVLSGDGGIRPWTSEHILGGPDHFREVVGRALLLARGKGLGIACFLEKSVPEVAEGYLRADKWY